MKNTFNFLPIVLFLFGAVQILDGQELLDSSKSISYDMKPNSREVTANFLSSYYQQDGNNGAVTGGIGTEKLTDFANIIILNVPLDSVNSIGLYGGADYYSSASTDNIDRFMSSASSSDVRSFATVSFNHKKLRTGETFGIRAGFSAEYDYTSFSTGLSYTKEWNQGNSEINFTTQAFFDNWLIIYPYELRGEVSLPMNSRRSYNGQINFSQVINKRLQMGLSVELVKMTGLLSTPFHRVYFSDASLHDIERLPASRLKVPLGIRLNYFPFDFLVMRTNYRFYWDDFGIESHTIELEAPIKLYSFLTIGPFYRYHKQSGSQFFAPFQTHLVTDQFYTSDYDLSSFNSHKFGLNIRYSPLYGVFQSKEIFYIKRSLALKYIESRMGYYGRSTGLNAYFVSLNFGLSLY